MQEIFHKVIRPESKALYFLGKPIKENIGLRIDCLKLFEQFCLDTGLYKAQKNEDFWKD